ncbi:docking protein 5-like isoform X2 [Engraulis encrasicolus]|uniref:docking protein 5-like isoform X2 n=1 Tax=Engraulis encrasicolus TaxID=184585 RepID=UPI002FD1EC6B
MPVNTHTHTHTHRQANTPTAQSVTHCQMDLEFCDIVKQGCVKIRRKHFWKCWLVYKRASSTGPKRLERFPNQGASNFHCHQKVIDLTDVISVTRPPQEKKKHALVLTFTDDSTLSFTCDSETEAADWYKVLNRECVHGGLDAFRIPEPDLLSSSLRHQTERFCVRLLPCKGLKTSGECVLQVNSEAITLWDTRTSHLKLASWPLTALRRFGSDRTWFSFEAGRSVHLTKKSLKPVRDRRGLLQVPNGGGGGYLPACPRRSAFHHPAGVPPQVARTNEYYCRPLMDISLGLRNCPRPFIEPESDEGCFS